MGDKNKKNKKMVIAEIRNNEEEKGLEKGIIIEDNLTWKEREIQQKLRKLASDEREKGKKVK